MWEREPVILVLGVFVLERLRGYGVTLRWVRGGGELLWRLRRTGPRCLERWGAGEGVSVATAAVGTM